MNILKGLIIGLGKVIPGVSGSILAISMGVYQKSIDCLNNFWKIKSIKYLLPLGIGIITSIVFGSKIILYFFNNYYLYTMILIIGLIWGTVPEVLKKNSLSISKIIVIFGVIIMLTKMDNFHLREYVFNNTLLDYLYVIFLGMLDAVCMILPGLSGTSILLMLSSYQFVMTLLANPFQFLFLFFVIGLLIGLFLMIKLVSYCFKSHETLMWSIILTFLFASIFTNVLSVIDLINQSNLFSVVLLFLIGYEVSSMFAS